MRPYIRREDCSIIKDQQSNRTVIKYENMDKLWEMGAKHADGDIWMVVGNE